MNIKIGKGGSGKISGIKLNINNVLAIELSGSVYSTGIYTRSSAISKRFDGPDGKYIILLLDNRWYAYDPAWDLMASTYISDDLLVWEPNDQNDPPTGKYLPPKLNEKKYIDLLPPTFISKVTLSGGDYSNGVYTRNSGGTTTFDGPDGKTIIWNGLDRWRAYDPDYVGGNDPTFESFDLITWIQAEAPGNLPIGVTENSLTFLFDPIFYKNEIQNERYKILLQGCSLDYVNGTYSQTVNPSLINNRPYFLKDDDQSVEIVFDGGTWYIYDLFERDYYELFIKNDICGTSYCRPDNLDLDWSSPDGGDAYNDGQTPPTITQYLNQQYKNGGRLDPAFLEQIRDYQINNTVPNQGVNPLSPQHIVGAAFNTKKGEIKNNTFSYIKYSDNSDVEEKKLNKWYGSISNTQSNYSINPPVDSKWPLLKINRNDSQNIFSIGVGVFSTLNMFVRLQRPVQHKNPNNGYIVREKRGIFCTSKFDNPSYNSFSIGYRSPYYNITGRPSYKSVFNNFSFVFSFGHNGYSGIFNRPVSFNLMTDYKFNFGEMYMLTIRSNDTYIEIYVNGELQTIALIPFNPLINPSYGGRGEDSIELTGGGYGNGVYTRTSGGTTTWYGPDEKYIEWNGGSLWFLYDPAFSPSSPAYYSEDLNYPITWYEENDPDPPTENYINNTIKYRRLYKTRRDEMPLGPGFYKKDGTVYSYTNTEYAIQINGFFSSLIFGKSALAYGARTYMNSKKKRRYLNNLDIGVISSYNTALSQTEISQIYNNFRYRYI
jgi:hypothetical protein